MNLFQWRGQKKLSTGTAPGQVVLGKGQESTAAAYFALQVNFKAEGSKAESPF